MSNPFDTPKFKALQAKWDQKLAKSGFDDIEQRDGNLKQWHAHLFHTRARAHEVERQGKEEYFRYATQFLHTYDFETKADKIIWENHSEGKTAPEIAKILSKRKILFNIRKIRARLTLISEIMVAQCVSKT